MAAFMSSRWLLPKGLLVESITRGADSITVAARSAAGQGTCPSCGQGSRRVHGRYRRTLADLPCSGRALRIGVMVRRFRCTMAACPARIFAERLDSGIAAPFARRTSRLDGLTHHLGLALGGRPGAGLATRLLLPVSRDTLLRTLRRRAGRPEAAASVIGIDDWAWKRGQRYGTLICDLQRHRVVDLLPDREPATLDAWLAAHPEIAIVARDRGGGYRQAVARVHPGALQVADRWHLVENASAAFLDAVRRLMAASRRAVGTTVIDPALLTRAERIQHDGYLRRERTNAAIVALAKGGLAIRAIVRRTGCSRKTVRQVLRGGRSGGAAGATTAAPARILSRRGARPSARGHASRQASWSGWSGSMSPACSVIPSSCSRTSNASWPRARRRTSARRPPTVNCGRDWTGWTVPTAGSWKPTRPR